MKNGLMIGRLLGINIYVDWSLATQFSQMHPTWGPGLSWGLALAAALLFFASVLGHELAHAGVAQAQGIPVGNITLFLFGGVANIQQEPRGHLVGLVRRRDIMRWLQLQAVAR